MPLDLSAVGRTGEPYERSWTSAEALLYALGVGAGQQDPLHELEFTTENSQDVEQRVLPTFGIILVQAGSTRDRVPIGDFDPAMLVHAEQAVTLHRPLPVEGAVRVTTTVTGIYDKGKGALVVIEATGVSPFTGEKLVTTRSSAFIRGEGGFGGERGPAADWTQPDRAPDHKVTYPTRADQALLYRLSGDRNPLHSDPAFAARAGFPRPILHGLCTYGVTGRALLHALCGSDPARFGSMSGRFSAPVYPGDELTVAIWATGPGEALFQTRTGDGTIVIDHGRVGYR
ncbi:MAG TPA: MaoC/PaaZ C-terminal domain-containing protein [Streptosporangiaceae bacterium]|nr:MaoC/PaaZ C-terminal domain-containing protein [Streptosporangiaceae bacterium]